MIGLPERERAPLTAWWSPEFWENRLFWCQYYLQRTEDAALARRFEALAEQAADNIRLLRRRDRRAARAEQLTGAVMERGCSI